MVVVRRCRCVLALLLLLLFGADLDLDLIGYFSVLARSSFVSKFLCPYILCAQSGYNNGPRGRSMTSVWTQSQSTWKNIL